MCGYMFKYGQGINKHASGCKKNSMTKTFFLKSNNQILYNFLEWLNFFSNNVYFLLLIIYNQINLYIVSRISLSSDIPVNHGCSAEK